MILPFPCLASKRLSEIVGSWHRGNFLKQTKQEIKRSQELIIVILERVFPGGRANENSHTPSGKTWWESNDLRNVALTCYVSSPGPKAAPHPDLTGSQRLDFFFFLFKKAVWVQSQLWRWTFRAKIIKTNSPFIKLRNVRLKIFLDSSDKTQESCKLRFSRKKN